jgi:hypothetical protein
MIRHISGRIAGAIHSILDDHMVALEPERVVFRFLCVVLAELQTREF